MKKVLKFLKRNIVGFLIGILLTSIVAVTATTLVPASAVAYSNSNSSVTNVNDALTELLTLAEGGSSWSAVAPDGTQYTLNMFLDELFRMYHPDILYFVRTVSTGDTSAAVQIGTMDSSGKILKSYNYQYNAAIGDPLDFFKLSYSSVQWHVTTKRTLYYSTSLNMANNKLLTRGQTLSWSYSQGVTYYFIEAN